MSNPFPGMNPYLENAAQWEMFHQTFIVVLMEMLNNELPDDFMARVGERLYIMQPGQFLPDVAILRRPIEETTDNGAVAIAVRSETEILDAPFHLQTLSVEMREPYIEIVSVRQEGRIIAGIELLSLSNKENGRGREEYLRKQHDMLFSDAHFLEIDLLRGGTHTVAIDRASVAVVVGYWNYIVCLHRAGAGNNFDVWVRDLRQRLPRVAVPLMDGYADVPLDLQAAVNRAYDMGAFGRAIDYRKSPTVDLPGNHVEWADTLLKSVGLR